MALRNACFISYRHGSQQLTKQFILQFHQGLAAEIEAQLGGGVQVFLDQERLRGGDLFNEAIATELCASACMVMIYTPSYFDLAQPYCAREYKGMLALEALRLKKLSNTALKTHGLIIPVLFRGKKYLPEEIGSYRQYHDFQPFLLAHRTLSKHKDFAPMLREIAEYISERYRELSALGAECFECQGFSLPSQAEIKDWLLTVIPGPIGLPRGTNA